MRLDMADAHVPVNDAQVGCNARAFAAELNARLAAGFLEHFDVRPLDAAAPTGAQNFEHRFLGGESAGEMLVICGGPTASG